VIANPIAWPKKNDRDALAGETSTPVERRHITNTRNASHQSVHPMAARRNAARGRRSMSSNRSMRTATTRHAYTTTYEQANASAPIRRI